MIAVHSTKLSHLPQPKCAAQSALSAFTPPRTLAPLKDNPTPSATPNVNDYVEVYWTEEDKWYPGKITNQTTDTTGDIVHSIMYDNYSKLLWHNFREEKWRLTGNNTDPDDDAALDTAVCLDGSDTNAGPSSPSATPSTKADHTGGGDNECADGTLGPSGTATAEHTVSAPQQNSKAATVRVTTRSTTRQANEDAVNPPTIMNNTSRVTRSNTKAALPTSISGCNFEQVCEGASRPRLVRSECFRKWGYYWVVIAVACGL